MCSALISALPRRKRRKRTALRRSPRTPCSAPTSRLPRRKRRRRTTRSPRSSIASRLNPEFAARFLRSATNGRATSPGRFVFRSVVAHHPVAFKHVDDTLRDIDERGSCRLRDSKTGKKPPRSAAVCDRDPVTRKPPVPFAHPQGYRLIAFTTGRNKMPLVLLTRSDALRIARMHLPDCYDLPPCVGSF